MVDALQKSIGVGGGRGPGHGIGRGDDGPSASADCDIAGAVEGQAGEKAGHAGGLGRPGVPVGGSENGALSTGGDKLPSAVNHRAEGGCCSGIPRGPGIGVGRRDYGAFVTDGDKRSGAVGDPAERLGAVGRLSRPGGLSVDERTGEQAKGEYQECGANRMVVK